jgi:uncharacterized protein
MRCLQNARKLLRMVDLKTEAVASPCNKVCRIDASTGWCEGCLRTLHEIGAWSQLDDADKREVVEQLAQRKLRLQPSQQPVP